MTERINYWTWRQSQPTRKLLWLSVNSDVIAEERACETLFVCEINEKNQIRRWLESIRRNNANHQTYWFNFQNEVSKTREAVKIPLKNDINLSFGSILNPVSSVQIKDSPKIVPEVSMELLKAKRSWTTDCTIVFRV